MFCQNKIIIICCFFIEISILNFIAYRNRDRQFIIFKLLLIKKELIVIVNNLEFKSIF